MTDRMSEARRANDALSALAACDLSAMSGHESVDLLGQLSTAMNTLNAVRFAALAVVHASGVWALDGSCPAPLGWPGWSVGPRPVPGVT